MRAVGIHKVVKPKKNAAELELLPQHHWQHKAVGSSVHNGQCLVVVCKWTVVRCILWRLRIVQQQPRA